VKTSPLAQVAVVAQRLAVLLAAGVAPGSAWEYLAEGPIPARIAASGSVAQTILDARLDGLEGQAWRGLAAAWSVATDAGAALAPSLAAYSRSLRSLAQAQRDAEVALAGPVATARLVMALPAVGMLFGLALGFDTLAVFGTPLGWACLVAGAALLLAGWRWNRRLIRAAQPADATPGIECDLMAIAVSGGGSIPGARAAVEAAIARFDLAARPGRVDGVLELSRRAGVPAAELLRSEADDARREARADAQVKAARLSVHLMIPLGVCVLPAFMVLGVFPLLASVISSTVAGF
jgi:tight adherence protein B